MDSSYSKIRNLFIICSFLMSFYISVILDLQFLRGLHIPSLVYAAGGSLIAGFFALKFYRLGMIVGTGEPSDWRTAFKEGARYITVYSAYHNVQPPEMKYLVLVLDGEEIRFVRMNQKPPDMFYFKDGSIIDVRNPASAALHTVS